MPDVNTPAPDPADSLAQQILEQVNALSRRIDKAERRVKLERALADAQASDVAAAADELEPSAEEPGADTAALVRRLKRDRPALFGRTSPAPGPSGMAEPPRAGRPNLDDLREQARHGDRASLLLYLQARRSRT